LAFGRMRADGMARSTSWRRSKSRRCRLGKHTVDDTVFDLDNMGKGRAIAMAVGLRRRGFSCPQGLRASSSKNIRTLVKTQPLSDVYFLRQHIVPFNVRHIPRSTSHVVDVFLSEERDALV
jgi:hypothetical protein